MTINHVDHGTRVVDGTYLVEWTLDVEDVDSPREAAEKAWDTMRTTDSTANVFTVTAPDGAVTEVDLQKNETEDVTTQPSNTKTIEIEVIETEEGATYTPFTDGWGVGYKVTAPGKPDRWIYLYPSQGDDLGQSNVFVYLDEYEPKQGEESPSNSITYINIWDDETPAYVWNDHANQLGDWCPWSGKPIGDQDDPDDDIACPAGCPASHAEESDE